MSERTFSAKHVHLAHGADGYQFSFVPLDAEGDYVRVKLSLRQVMLLLAQTAEHVSRLKLAEEEAK